VFLTMRWLRPSRRSLWSLLPAMLQGQSPFSPQEEALVAARITPEFMTTTILTATVVGLLFARSLHYQFYAYLAWATPFLLWRATGSVAVVYGLWAAQEWAWNVFPSTPASSAVVVGVMAATVALVWRGTREGARVERPATSKKTA
jgi:alpha-1,3-mannosyltransferase